MSKNDVIMNFNTGYYECHNCGAWFDFNCAILPAPLSFSLKISEAFGKEHRECYTQTERGRDLQEAAATLSREVVRLKDEGCTSLDLPEKIRAFMTKLPPYHGFHVTIARQLLR